MFVVSYPKAGRTWARYILGRLAVHEFGDRALASAFIEHDDLDVNGRRIRFTHAFGQRDELDQGDMALAASYFSKTPFVFLCRDPGAVLCSYFHERTKRSLKKVYEPGLTFLA